MATKKTKSKTTNTKPKKTKTTKKSKSKGKSKKKKEEPISDLGLVVVEDDIGINKEAELEERRAYLEEARSQEAFD